MDSVGTMLMWIIALLILAMIFVILFMPGL